VAGLMSNAEKNLWVIGCACVPDLLLKEESGE